MTNVLSGNVQVVNLYPGSIVWYTPEGFPDVQTDADLVDGDGDLLLVHNGWRWKIISVQQVKRIMTGYRYAAVELYDAECSQFDQANSGQIG